jgi:glutaconate CoA-transferase, subunit B
LCLMEPDPVTKELVVTSIHPGVDAEVVKQNTGWPIKFAEHVRTTDAPTTEELQVLRDLLRRTEEAHGADA